MDNFIEEDNGESRFFDALEHISQDPFLISEENFTCNRNWEYDVWIGTPQSVKERRSEFVRWMESSPDGENTMDNFDRNFNSKNGVFADNFDRIVENSGAVLRTTSIEDEFSSSRSSVSSWASDDLDLSRGVDLSSSECRNGSGNSNCGNECNFDGRLGQIRVKGLNNLISSREFENVSNLSHSVQQFEQREAEINVYTPRTIEKLKLKDRCLSKLRSMTCMISNNVKDDNLRSHNLSTKIRRVKVRDVRKKSKEFSALFAGQDIEAHHGSILAMKFSQGGEYLASGGEDKVLRIWQVMEDERSQGIDIPDADPSCVYFSVNHLSELGPHMVEKDKINKSKSLKKTKDSACVIFPPKVFRILEKPLHVFKGHKGEILDLSWSKDNCLLSSSVDKTVRLWKVGVDHCLKVFSHSDYVTCTQFNPVNDDYFISGSIDGKVRIWAVSGCQVVDWTETKDIITAVSYRPDGQGGIIGSVTGTCRFFNISDNHLQLDTQICITNKKKPPCRRITGFQFLPQDPSKILVTCADSQVRIIDGINVIGKYKGLRNATTHCSASFTADGNHIVSASEDSNIYIWNYNGQRVDPSFKQPKSIKSFECFASDASVAIPWSGTKPSQLYETSIKPLPFSSSTCFSLNQEFYLDSSSKGSATWPEEKLPMSTNPSPMGKSQYKFFKTSCQSSSSSHAWGLVIVTAGWDGRIKVFHNYGLPVPL